MSHSIPLGYEADAAQTDTNDTGTTDPIPKQTIEDRLYSKLNGLKRNWTVSIDQQDGDNPAEITVSHFAFSKHVAVHVIRDEADRYAVTVRQDGPLQSMQQENTIVTDASLIDAIDVVSRVGNKMAMDRGAPTRLHRLLDSLIMPVFNASSRIHAIFTK